MFVLKLFLKRLSILASLLLLVILFQNCSEKKMHFELGSVQNKYGQIDCAGFGAGEAADCLQSENGLIGNLYYLQDKDPSSSASPRTMIDKNGNEKKLDSSNFPDVSSVISQGIKHKAFILMESVSVPTVQFTSGFKVGNSALTDTAGNRLIEAFAMDLKGDLILKQGMSPGYYQLATISDDGSVLEVSSRGNTNYDITIDNDGWQAPHSRCSDQAVYLDKDSKLPIRLRYFQGPRTAIAMTMLMRKVDSSQGFAKDTQNCGISDGSKHQASGYSYFFGQSISSPGYVPDYKNSIVGYMIKKGWFIPDRHFFGLPDELK